MPYYPKIHQKLFRRSKVTSYLYRKKLTHKKTLAVAVVAALSLMATSQTFADDNDDDEKKIVFIHTGDFHGDLDPHSNLRAGSSFSEGGLARVSTVVKKIRKKNKKNSIHVHTGDTMAGSAMASFTRGEALINVVDQLGIDAFAPGNWEFSFGIYRYLQYFGTAADIEPINGDDWKTMAVGIPPFEQGHKAAFGAPFPDAYRWGAVASNAYINGTKPVEAGTRVSAIC